MVVSQNKSALFFYDFQATQLIYADKDFSVKLSSGIQKKTLVIVLCLEMFPTAGGNAQLRNMDIFDPHLGQ